MTATATDTIAFEPRFQGFGNGALGGYAAGAVAKRLGGAAEVNLKALPPLERELEVREVGEGLELRDGDTVVLEAASAEFDLEIPDLPSAEDIARAGIHPIHDEIGSHPYPACFCCGPAREEGDALRVFMARSPSDPEHLVAAWTPFRDLVPEQDELPAEMLWGALDCPTIWAAWAPDRPARPPEGTFTVLARQRLEQLAPIPLGEQAIVTAWPISRDGRKRLAGAAVHGRGGILLARAESLLVEVPV